jgi:hypothetical protein
MLKNSQLLAVVRSEEDAQGLFEQDAEVRDEFVTAEALWGYTKKLRAGQISVHCGRTSAVRGKAR